MDLPNGSHFTKWQPFDKMADSQPFGKLARPIYKMVRPFCKMGELDQLGRTHVHAVHVVVIFRMQTEITPLNNTCCNF